MGAWQDDEKTLWLLKPDELAKLPDGAKLTDINGGVSIKGKDTLDDDVRFGHLAYGLTAAQLGIERPPKPAGIHPTHKLRSSDASTFDLACEHCGANDAAGGNYEALTQPCKGVAAATEPAKPRLTEIQAGYGYLVLWNEKIVGGYTLEDGMYVARIHGIKVIESYDFKDCVYEILRMNGVAAVDVDAVLR